MLRIFPALIGAGLAAMWVIGLSEDATVWLTWLVGIAAALAFATVGLIPERQRSLWAAACLGLLSGGLGVMWLIGLVAHARPWLTWWTFVAALLTGAVAAGAAVQGGLDNLRTREPI
ncbi:MAG TPA: hypothetical protein VHO06_07005 [Polyangia bacterium]|nr:hypothetical protein [Polyangia bacterium]